MSHQFETIEFDAYDGVACNLKHLLNENISKGPVLLVHGAGVRANIFNPRLTKTSSHSLPMKGMMSGLKTGGEVLILNLIHGILTR